MSQYYSLLTTIGQNKIAADIAGGPNLDLVAVTVGDGGGSAYNPVETQTALLGERYRVGIAALGAVATGVIVLDCTIPATGNDVFGRPAGGFNIVEVGVLDAVGALIAVAKVAPTYKPDPSQGQASAITFQIKLQIGSNNVVTITVDAPQLIHVGRLLNADWTTVDAVVSAPPANPGFGMRVAIKGGATGIFSGKVGHLADWNGTAWYFINCRFGQNIVDASVDPSSDARYLKRDASNWGFAKAGQAVYGPTKFATLAETRSVFPVSDLAIDPFTLRSFVSVAGLSAYSVPGTYTLVVPPGVFRAYGIVDGAGGGGGGSNGAAGGGSGGASGSHIEGVFPVAPGETLVIVVGAGGARGAGGTGLTSGVGGGGSSIARPAGTQGGVQLFAGGGGAGVAGNGGAQNTFSGQGGNVSAAAWVSALMAPGWGGGFAVQASTGIIFGGSGGAPYFGGPSALSVNGPGSRGHVRAGGGSGGAAGFPGGLGGAGFASVYWVL